MTLIDAFGLRESHVVALSGGKDSTAMALRLAEVEPRDYLYVCTPTGDEFDEMVDHWRRLGELLGEPLTFITRRSLRGEIRRQRALPNHRMRWCTRILKIEPYEKLLVELAKRGPVTSYVGMRADEPERSSGVYDHIPGITMRFPMREWGWGIGDVRRYLAERGVEIPRRTDCRRCFWQTLPELYWWWRNDRAGFEEAAGDEEWVSAKRGRPVTMRSPQRDTWPAGLRELGVEFERGRVPRGVDPESAEPAISRSRCRVCSM